MDEIKQGEFLRKRMIELREKNHKSQSEMADLLFVNKSTLSRVESGNTSYKNIKDFAERYCRALLPIENQENEEDKEEQEKYIEKQITLFLRGTKAVVTDTSALLKKLQLIEDLSKEYSMVIIPQTVIDELDNIKDKNTKGLAPKAWQILRSISANANIIIRDYTGNDDTVNNDGKILDIAKKASEEFNCPVDIITYDTGFAARLSGTDTAVSALFLEEYIAKKQNLLDMSALKKIDEYYADSYENIEEALGIPIPDGEDLNAYLPNGNTLIISAVRCRTKPVRQRKAKIKWLIEHGADVDKRDSGRYNIPPLSHVIQNNDRFPEHDLEIFIFLLKDCHANPNVGSRDPHDYGKIRQKNGGNMPLMIAAWHNKPEFVKALCEDERTSLNQQDGNGFTALIKACGNGFLECRDILRNAGADTKIVDRDGQTADDRYNEFLETGLRMNRKYDEGKNSDNRNRNRNGNNYGKRR